MVLYKRKAAAKSFHDSTLKTAFWATSASGRRLWDAQTPDHSAAVWFACSTSDQLCDFVCFETSLNLISHISKTEVTVMVLNSWRWENSLKLVSTRVSAHSELPQINIISILTLVCIRLHEATADGHQKLTSCDSVYRAHFNWWLLLAVLCFLFSSFIREGLGFLIIYLHLYL